MGIYHSHVFFFLLQGEKQKKQKTTKQLQTRERGPQCINQQQAPQTCHINIQNNKSILRWRIWSILARKSTHEFPSHKTWIILQLQSFSTKLLIVTNSEKHIPVVGGGQWHYSPTEGCEESLFRTLTPLYPDPNIFPTLVLMRKSLYAGCQTNQYYHRILSRIVPQCYQQGLQTQLALGSVKNYLEAQFTRSEW